MNLQITVRLSVMMFLQFFVWGSWYVTMGTFLPANLGASGVQTGMAYSTQSWGAIIAPFIIGLIADRFFNAERILGFLHIAGGILMYLLYMSADFGTFYPFILLYMILYMPTLALVNSVAFRQMDDPARQFGWVRVWGTIGWIVAGLLIGYVFLWESKGNLQYTFLMGSICSLALGLFAFTLPKTPPKIERSEKISVGDIVGIDALKLLKDRNFAIFFISSILICIPLAFYYQLANPFLNEIGVANAAGIMTLGQASEVAFMLLLPLFLTRFGIKKTLVFGMLAWGIRYALFAYGNEGSLLSFLIIGILLHGICYDFFFVSGQIYTDSKAGEKYQSSAQGMITLATYGLGMLIGFWAAGLISDAYITDGGHNWQTIWLIPAGFAVLVLVLFTAIFKNEKINYNPNN
ncbi:MAG: nucleoside permease [Bacteroidota bacterium]